jgi:hypothetical protein
MSLMLSAVVAPTVVVVLVVVVLVVAVALVVEEGSTKATQLVLAHYMVLWELYW